MFTFDDDNQNSNNYPDILGSDFKVISKTNLIENGSGKYSLSIFKDPSSDEEGGFYIPQGGWSYCTYDGIEDRRRGESLYESTDDYHTGGYLEDGQTGRDFADTFVNGTYDYPEEKDNQKRTGYAGYYPYFFDYRNLPADYIFESTIINANSQGNNVWSDIKTWNTIDQDIDAYRMPNSWVRNRNTDSDDNIPDGAITDMHIKLITDVTSGKELYWSKSKRKYIRGDYDSDEHGNNFFDGFTRFIKGNEYIFTFTTVDEGEYDYAPSINSLSWTVFLDYGVELEAFNQFRDESTPLGSPLRLQQNLRHATTNTTPRNSCTNFLYMNHHDAFVGVNDGQYSLIDSDLIG